MGYLTTFRLTVTLHSDDVESCGHDNPSEAVYCMHCGHKLGLPSCIEEEVIKYASTIDGELDDYDIFDVGVTMKWYRHHAEMTDISKWFPNYLFTLEGEGEEAEDLWRVYYLNGKSQMVDAVITFADFDESKLK